jgi:integration host factor subunit beta
MTKSDLIDVLCETQKMPKGRAELLVNVIFDSMEASLRRGERIEIRGFGSFEIREYRAYEGRNPRTGSAVAVKPKRLPFFKVGKELKERVDAGARRGAKPAPAGGVAPRAGSTEAAQSPTSRVSA